MRSLASLWQLEQLSPEKVPLYLALVGFIAAAAEMPEQRALANELVAQSWDELSSERGPTLDGGTTTF